MNQDKLKTLLQQSRANEAFKQAVIDFSKGRPTPLIQCQPARLPVIKVLRVLMKLLETYPDKAITSVAIQGVSTCSGFYGTLTFEPGARKIRFNWDCQWKAEQEGLKTWYGAPDQTKAAQIFGYQCFERFEEED